MKPLKKSVLSLFLLFVAVFSLTACTVNPVVEEDLIVPEIQGLPADLTFNVEVGDIFNPTENVYAFDPIDGDVTEQMFVLGVDQLALQSNGTLTKSGEYLLTYVVINSSGRKAETEVTVVVTSFFEELANYEVGEYNLVWSDEFDYVGSPDPTKWNRVVGGSGFGNNEIQYYTDRDENSYVDNGFLTISLLNETYGNRNFTSAKLTTHNLESWTYGKMEISAKLPSGLGTWPAIWMMPENSVYGGWPRSGEIDIMEHVGYKPNVTHGTVHTYDYNGQIGTQRGGDLAVPTAMSEFHVYSIEWLPNKIIWAVDGEEFYTYRFEVDGYSTLTEDDYWRIWPYDDDFYLILNVAFGGNWGGAAGIDYDLQSAEMVIDYVRVYEATGLSEE